MPDSAEEVRSSYPKDKGEVCVSSWMDSHPDLIWLYVQQSGIPKRSAFATFNSFDAADVSDQNAKRLMFGQEDCDFSTSADLTDEQIEELINKEEPFAEDWHQKDTEWQDHAITLAPGEKLLLRPDFLYLSSNLNSPGLCLIDAKRRRRKSDNTFVLKREEVRALQNLEVLTSTNVWIALLDGDACPETWLTGYFVPVSQLPFFKQEPERLMGNTVEGWRYALESVPGTLPFSNGQPSSFKASALFRRV